MALIKTLLLLNYQHECKCGFDDEENENWSFVLNSIEQSE
ncbi:10044_t:CDS:2 [Diversispora eburnea]|uniref:10044_t:CDS:1 n=1 Tax=Diversispora eburnea TaxID=1213867 RepID=A0A9N8WNC6_9GLOM|nr:10044_t:CDS:2 [Diversispora eburnea]